MQRESVSVFRVHILPSSRFTMCVRNGLTVSPKDALSDKDSAKVGLFIAASVGTFALMAAVYCIYNKFYTKQQYLHAQLHDDSGELAGPRQGKTSVEEPEPLSAATDRGA